MSKSKSVSDIMRHQVVFPNGREQSTSAVFEVRNHPMILKAYNMGCDTVGHIEMGHHDGCGGWTWTPFSPLCDQVLLVTCSNIVAITVPGWYRVVFRNRITGELETGLDDLLVTVVETDMPVSMLAQYGGSTMACGNRVSIHPQENGCVIINVDDTPYTICPGSQVSCSPEGGGVIIDGELCPFPSPVSARVDDNCLILTIGTETISFCNTDTNSVTTASIDSTTGAVTITNPDGSEVTFDGRNSITTASIDSTTGAVTVTNPDGSEVTFDGRNSVTVASVDEDGLVTITNPDNSTVQFNGNDSVTIADLDAAAQVLTITNPDGSEVTIPYFNELPDPGTQVSIVENDTGDYTITISGEDYDIRQTRVQRGSGSVGNQQTLTALHQGTWPNTVWREPWIERNGDLVTMTAWNPTLNRWDSFTLEAPENLVILNNPVIYFRTGGSANPPITTQEDLTVANAFNGIPAILNFLRRALVIGTVTLDGRGEYPATGTLTSADFKNAQNVILRGDPADETALLFTSIRNQQAVQYAGGGLLTFRDASVYLEHTPNSPAGRQAGVGAGGGSQVNLAGVVRIGGNADVTDPTRLSSAFATLAYGAGSRLQHSGRVIIDFDPGHELSGGPSAVDGGTMALAPTLTFEFARDFDADSFFRIGQGCTSTAYFLSSPPPVVAGPGKIVGANTWRLDNLATLASSGWTPLTGAPDALWPQDVLNNRVFPYAVVNGVMGLDL